MRHVSPVPPRARAAHVVAPLAAALVCTAAGAAHAQQPLAEFLAAAEGATDVREAHEAFLQASSAAEEARGRLLPSFTASAAYTRNEPVVELNFGGMSRPLQPADQLDGRFTLTVPILDLAAWQGFFAAEESAEGADARAALARDTVRASVVQLWHQLVAARALVRAVEGSVHAAEEARGNASSRVEVGVSPPAELARAEAELARAHQSLAEARLGAILAARNLEVTSTLAPTDALATLDDDLHAEAPLERFVGELDRLPAVRAAHADVRAAERSLDGAWFALLPTIAGSGAARVTNAVGFAGRNDSWAFTATASWTFDLVRPFTIGTRDHALRGARIREEEARLGAETAVLEGWHRVVSSIERAEASRAALAASTRAADDARARYEAGAGTQLEAVLAERDRFSAEVSAIQALGDLRVARAALRIRAGLPLEGE